MIPATAARRLIVVAGLLAGSVAHAEQEPAFGPPQPVALRGYDGDAMEPFLTRDGRYLLFNNRNDPDVDTNLHVARRVDDLNFDWQGELNSANSPVLDGVPSVDDRDNLYFVSLRAYAETLSTIYQARFDGVATSFPKLVDGVSRRLNGFVNFDAEISGDGRLLFFVDGRFSGGPHPRSADIAIAVRDGPRFRRLPDSDRLLARINTSALEYAPALSVNQLELLFTRIDRRQRMPRPEILRAVRRHTHEPFGEPEPIPALSGFVEAPALSTDGRLLYFHKLEGGRFVLYMSRR
jgi:hypothetical protein